MTTFVSRLSHPFKLNMDLIRRKTENIENIVMEIQKMVNLLKYNYTMQRAENIRKENIELKKQIQIVMSDLLKEENEDCVKDFLQKAMQLYNLVEQPDPTCEVPGAAREVPVGANEVPAAANEVPAAANEVPAAANEVPAAANEVPVGARELLVAAHEVPAAANEKSKVTAAPKKEKIKKPQAEKKPEAEEPVHVGRLDLRVGQIMQVDKHPDADSLYVSKIQCGFPSLRTVVSGLVKFVPIAELENRKVVVLCNLKPAKMRGILSEAMVMCASTPEIVEVLSPPDAAEPGDLIECAGFARQPDAQLNPKKKIFEGVAPDLKTNDSLEACYKGTPLFVPGKGSVTTKSLKNVNIK